MKNIIIMLCLLITTQLNSQTDYRTFKVVSTGTVSEIEITQYELAIKGASMESYRFKTKSNIIVFDSGFKVELKSAQECYILGVNMDPSGYSDTREARYTDPTFHLVIPNGGIPQAPGQKPYLVALYKHIEK
jgi:hypothetical protein